MRAICSDGYLRVKTRGPTVFLRTTIFLVGKNMVGANTFRSKNVHVECVYVYVFLCVYAPRWLCVFVYVPECLCVNTLSTIGWVRAGIIHS